MIFQVCGKGSMKEECAYKTALSVFACLFFIFSLSSPCRAASPLAWEERVAAASRAGDYLCSVVRPDGAFVYEYDPSPCRETGGYNWLRHCGAVIALCQIYEAAGQEKHLRAAEKSAGAIVNRIKPVEINGKQFRALVSGDGESGLSVKTGGAALAAAALLTLDQVRGTRDMEDAVRELCRYMRHAQTEAGEMLAEYALDKDAGAYEDWSSQFYQGQAVLALAMVEKVFPARENREAMMKLLNFLACQWQLSLEKIAPRPFDHWGMIGLSRAWPLVDDQRMEVLHGQYLNLLEEQVKQMAENLESLPASGSRKELERQLKWRRARVDSVRKAGVMTQKRLLQLGFAYCGAELHRMILDAASNRHGSFWGNPGSLSPSATRIEGVSAFANLALRIPDSSHVEAVTKWLPRVDLGRRFVLKCQYGLQDPEVLACGPSLAGGVRRHVNRHAGPKVRIDYCQHAMSALLGWGQGGKPAF